jgi:ABC-type lipoprotein release transport system permease subunit
VIRKHSPENTAASAIAIIRTGMPPQAMAKWVRAEVAALDPTLPVSIETVEQRVGKLAARPRFNALLLGIFAGMGLMLTAIGLYGLMAFLVTQRTQEIGVRMALGSTPGAITRLVLEQAGLWTVAGGGLGVIGSLFAVRLIESMLFHVPAKDPWTLVGASGLLAGVALAAAWIPSRRAARIDPIQALRQE